MAYVQWQVQSPTLTFLMLSPKPPDGYLPNVTLCVSTIRYGISIGLWLSCISVQYDLLLTWGLNQPSSIFLKRQTIHKMNWFILVRYEGLPAVLLRIRAFWFVTMRVDWEVPNVSKSRNFFFLNDQAGQNNRFFFTINRLWLFTCLFHLFSV